MIENFLVKIVDARRRRVEELKRTVPLSEEAVVLGMDGLGRHTRSLYNALNRSDRVNFIAEVKKASPSKGLLRDPFEPIEVAIEYESNGAAAVSVLTEEDYFLGSLQQLQAIQQNISRPILRKDFIVDKYQIYESAVSHVNAILLIVAILTPEQLLQFKQVAENLKLEVLVEVHDLEERKIAMDCGAKMIGVNNRDLKTFEVNLNTSLKLAPHFPSSIISVSESGIGSPDDIRKLRDVGYNAFLVGEKFLKAAHPGQALRELIIRSLN